MLELGLKSLLAYLIGSLIGSLVIGRLKGVDIREQGSGNAGGTNALRTQGWAFALGVVAIDVGKAFLAVGLLPGLGLPGVGVDPALDREWLAVCCAIAVVVGHVYPVWYEFRGGKGAATLLGAVAVLAPAALLPVALVWLGCVVLTGFVGLDPAVDREWLAVSCAAAAVAGHVYPVWYEFRGGKGAATLLGAVAVLAPAALLPVALAWLACVMLTGYVGLGTMVGVATLPAYLALTGTGSAALVAFGVAMAAFVAYTHRSNLARMLAGNENRARRLWLLRPR